MTGLDRLRELADDVIGSVWANTSSIYCKKYGLSVDSTGGSFSDFLRQIADQIEAEQEERITRRLEDREAAEWVREHGGLDSVKELLDWVVGHCSTRQQLDFDFWLSGRVMHELGFEEDMADRDEVERRLLARLVPEGYEWPRYESGGSLRYEDRYVYDGREREVWHVDFDSCGKPTILNKDGTRCHLDKGERVKRPAPLRAGETVYLQDGESFTVDFIRSDGNVAVRELSSGMYLRPERLTHAKPERPDSWERLEEDAEKDPCSYFGFDGEETCGKCPASGKNCEQTMARDLVRRCRAMAERERGE